jgi:hypothetical protein
MTALKNPPHCLRRTVSLERVDRRVCRSWFQPPRSVYLGIGLVVAALFSIRSRKKGRNDILRMFNFVKLKNGNILMTLKK